MSNKDLLEKIRTLLRENSTQFQVFNLLSFIRLTMALSGV